MIKEPNPFVAARAAFERAAQNLADPDKLDDLRNAVVSLLGVISGASPKIEKDIAKKMLLTCRNKVLAEVKALIADLDSCEARALAHWHQVMEVFADSTLHEDPEFNACRDRLRTLRAPRAIVPFETEPAAIGASEQPEAGRPNDSYSGIIKEVRSMPHNSSLSAIGQSLETLRLRDFRLVKQGHFFIVRSESLRETHDWILRNHLVEKGFGLPVSDVKSTQLIIGEGWLCYGPVDIARLNARQRYKASDGGSGRTGETDLAQLLYALGEHLDNRQASDFEILWARDSVSVDYQTLKGSRERKDFTIEKLRHLALYSRLRKPNRGRSAPPAGKPRTVPPAK